MIAAILFEYPTGWLCGIPLAAAMAFAHSRLALSIASACVSRMRSSTAIPASIHRVLARIAQPATFASMRTSSQRPLFIDLYAASSTQLTM